ncbi:ankyrin repeat domain-containing protein [Lysobacter brunescens]|uniref:Ankyrin repeat domain-containing protein n=1 Tax=Lysobacter brunescens TaxID=262323 RepID=A0ABW2Y7N2_9GAMM
MAKQKRKTLPKNFGEMLDNAPLDDLIAVFGACDLESTGGYGKSTALGFYNCPDALVEWLVAQGADINAADAYGRTPLHHRSASWKGGVDRLLSLGADIEARDDRGHTPLHAAAESHKSASVDALLKKGADPHARTTSGATPLELALTTTRNIDIVETAKLAEALLTTGVTVTDTMRAEVERIGREFEFHRAGFNPEFLTETDDSLHTLYRLFATRPAAQRVMHDGVSPIRVAAMDWPDQHQALWELLVPSSGAAATVQGEAIRITGRLSQEILDNGGVNWNAHFRAMLDAFVAHIASGTSLPHDAVADARRIATGLRHGKGDVDQLRRLAELAVHWVIANPDPIALLPPTYAR